MNVKWKQCLIYIIISQLYVFCEQNTLVTHFYHCIYDDCERPAKCISDTNLQHYRAAQLHKARSQACNALHGRTVENAIFDSAQSRLINFN